MIPMYLWLRWKLGHKEFKPYGRSHPAVRPNVGLGGQGQSPIPARWWNELRARWMTRNPIPLTVDPHAFFRSVGFGTAWGFSNGQFVDRLKVELGTVAAADLRPFVMALRARGASYVAVQDRVETRALRDALKQACREFGMKLAVWEWGKDAPTALATIRYWQPDGYIVNVEHYGQWDALASAVATTFPTLPRAVWTNFTGAGAGKDGEYDSVYSAPWRQHGFTCIPEAYLCDSGSLSPAVMDWTARTHLSYSEVVVSPGIYHGSNGNWPLERYFSEGGLGAFPHYLVYLAEYLPEFP